MYDFELSVNKTHCCSCRDGAGEMFLTNVQQDQQDPLFYLCYLFSCLLHGDLFFVKDPAALNANVSLPQTF